jgi:hypothetical protein
MSLWNVFQSKPSQVEYINKYSYITLPAHADFADRSADSFTWEGYFNIIHYGAAVNKSYASGVTESGWYALISNATLSFNVYLYNDYLWGPAYGGMYVTMPYSLVDNTWHHAAFQFYHPAHLHPTYSIYLDGIMLTATLSASYPYYGSPGSDAAIPITIGGRVGGSSYPFPLDAGTRVGWQRFSNSVRYASNFSPYPLDYPPSLDANTLGQWNMTEGSGLALNSVDGNAAKNGTHVNGVWYPYELDLNL